MNDHLDTIKADLQRRAAALERQRRAIGMVDQLLRDLTALDIEHSIAVDKGGSAITLCILAPGIADPQKALPPPAAESDAPPPPERPASPPAAAPVEKIDIPQAPKAKARSALRWTEEEDERAIQLTLEGKTAREVAAALGRPLSGTKYRIGQNLRARIEARRGQPAPAAPVTASAPTSAAAPCDASLSPSDRSVEARLNALGYVKPWDSTLDLEMVELLISGTKAAHAAEILEIPKHQVINRWHRLCPDPTFENQKRLITALRRRAAA